MSVSRMIRVFGFIVGLSLMGCDSAAISESSSKSPQSAGSTPTASTPASAAAQSSRPSPSNALAPATKAAVWLRAGDLAEPRNIAHVVLLGTGEVLVVGSDWSCGASTNGSDSVEIGDPQTGVWETTTSLPNLRDEPSVVALNDGRGLLIGGAAGEDVGWSAYSSTYTFEPTTRL